jgi:hypothetical protein
VKISNTRIGAIIDLVIVVASLLVILLVGLSTWWLILPAFFLVVMMGNITMDNKIGVKAKTTSYIIMTILVTSGAFFGLAALFMLGFNVLPIAFIENISYFNSIYIILGMTAIILTFKFCMFVWEFIRDMFLNFTQSMFEKQQKQDMQEGIGKHLNMLFKDENEQPR